MRTIEQIKRDIAKARVNQELATMRLARFQNELQEILDNV